MATKSKPKNLIGGWAFLIGVILAVILGLFGTVTPALVYAFVIIGIIIGLLNIADEEAMPFLISGIILIIASAFGTSVVQTIPIFEQVLRLLLDIFVPAIIIVAIRNVLSIARK